MPLIRSSQCRLIGPFVGIRVTMETVGRKTPKNGNYGETLEVWDYAGEIPDNKTAVVTQTACRSVKARPLEMSTTVSHEARCEIANLAKQSQERLDGRLGGGGGIIQVKKKKKNRHNIRSLKHIYQMNRWQMIIKKNAFSTWLWWL